MKIFGSELAFRKDERLALLAIAAFILVFFKPVVSGDGFGYYVILEGAVRDQTFNLSEQLRYNAVANGTEVFYVNATGRFASQYAPGLPLLSAPLYAASLFFDDFWLFHVQDDFFVKERGDILVHQASMALTTLAIFLAGLVASLFLCREIGLKRGGAAAAIAFFGTPIIRYASYDLTYTHAAEAGLLALLLLLFWKGRPAWQLGILLGLMTLVRYTSALFFVPFGVYFILRKRHKDAALLAFGMVPFVLLLMAYFWVQFGSPFTPGYALQEGFFSSNFSALPAHVPRVLFSLEGNPPGILWWSPLLLLAFAGLYFLEDERKWVLLGIAAVMFWTTGSFYQGTTGFSFSNRYFAALYPLAALGTAVLLEKGKAWSRAVWALAAYGFVMFLLVFPVDWGHFVGPAEVLGYWFSDGSLLQLPAALWEKVGLVRLLLMR